MTLLSVVSNSAWAAFSDGGGDFFWTNPIFAKEVWESFTQYLRLFLAFGGALLLIYEIRSRRMGIRFRQRTLRRVAWVLTILSFGVYFDFFNPNVRYPNYYHRHEFYHYYLGSKYFSELGYLRLYECTLVAQVELGQIEDVRNRDFRDLRVNLIRPVSESYILSDPDQCKKHFSAARWEEFKKDQEWFHANADKDYWQGMQRDHGYNPPPVWTMTGKLLSSLGSADDRFFKLLAGIDVVLNAGTLLLFNWAFGFRVMAVAAIFWGVNAPADFAFTGGAFLRQDWLFLLVAAVCLARKRKFALAGFALTWSALLRIFPGIFVFGWLVIAGIHLAKKLRQANESGQKLSVPKLFSFMHPDHRRLFGGCVVAMATLVPLSAVTCGPDSYTAFYQHTLRTHQNTPLTNHMGLETMLVHTWNGRMRFAQDDNQSDAFEGWKKGRIERFHRMKPVFWAIVAIIGAWTAWALRSTRLLWVGTALSLPMVMCLTNLTCYYYSLFIVGAVLVAVRPQLGAPFLAASAIGKIIQYPPVGFFWLDDRWTAETWLYFALALCLLAGYSRPFSVQALKAWWNGERSKPGALAAPSASEAQTPT